MKELKNLIRIFPLSSIQSGSETPWITDLNSGINIISTDKVVIEPEDNDSDSGVIYTINGTFNIATPENETLLAFNHYVNCIIIMQDSEQNIHQLGEINNPVHAHIYKGLNFSKLNIQGKLIKNPFF